MEIKTELKYKIGDEVINLSGYRGVVHGFTSWSEYPYFVLYEDGLLWNNREASIRKLNE